MLKLCLIGLSCLFPAEIGKNDPVPFLLSVTQLFPWARRVIS